VEESTDSKKKKGREEVLNKVVPACERSGSKKEGEVLGREVLRRRTGARKDVWLQGEKNRGDELL